MGEGNGNPLQYSCLEKSMDIGTWRATVYGPALAGRFFTTNATWEVQYLWIYLAKFVFTLLSIPLTQHQPLRSPSLHFCDFFIISFHLALKASNYFPIVFLIILGTKLNLGTKSNHGLLWTEGPPHSLCW